MAEHAWKELRSMVASICSNAFSISELRLLERDRSSILEQSLFLIVTKPKNISFDGIDAGMTEIDRCVRKHAITL
jgi:hypothetical protein